MRNKGEHGRTGTIVLDAFIDALDWPTALSRIATWAAHHESRYVCICNVHSVVSAGQDPEFGKVINEADMATPAHQRAGPDVEILRTSRQSWGSRVNLPVRQHARHAGHPAKTNAMCFSVPQNRRHALPPFPPTNTGRG